MHPWHNRLLWLPPLQIGRSDHACMTVTDDETKTRQWCHSSRIRQTEL